MKHLDLFLNVLMYYYVQCELMYLCNRIILQWGAVVGGGKFTPATHNSSICSLPERVRAVQYTCCQAATSTLAVLHPCLCGCMKYSAWEEVGRWKSGYKSELDTGSNC